MSPRFGEIRGGLTAGEIRGGLTAGAFPAHLEAIVDKAEVARVVRTVNFDEAFAEFEREMRADEWRDLVESGNAPEEIP